MLGFKNQKHSTKWVALNPILKEGEVAFERDTKRFKIGDGKTPYNNLLHYLPNVTVDAADLSGYARVMTVVNPATDVRPDHDGVVFWVGGTTTPTNMESGDVHIKEV